MAKAVFHPQAWQNDYAISVDPEGETEWEVEEDEVEAVMAEYGVSRERVLESDQYPSDDFRFSRNAPQWVRDWEGPFYVAFPEEV